MKHVFTRWPGEPTAMPDSDIGDDLPRWTRSPAPMPVRGLGIGQKWLIEAAVAAMFGSVVLLPIPLNGWTFVIAAMGLLISTGGLILVAFALDVALRRLRAELERSERWTETLFQRAGISLWREDWTAARDAIGALLRQGVRDVQAYYTANPQALRELRRQVIIKDVNPFALDMMGVTAKSDLVGSLDNILPDTDTTFMQWLVAFARGDRYYRSETHIVRPDGSEVETLFTAEIPTDAAGFEDIVVSALDITGYKLAQQRLLQIERDMLRASRITTMGALSASIAHEVNSPLAAIISHAEAARRWLDRAQPDLSESIAAIEYVVSDATRARDVVQRTRAYLSNSPARPEWISLAATARNAILLVERELREHDVAVHFDADEHLPEILADPVQVQQVIINLLLNGAQAMAGAPAPRDLTITLRREGSDVRVSVRDEGVGIAAERMALIFEPFYSDREGGIGMGLAICRTVIEAQGGRISVTSEPGAGSVFSFTLPVDASTPAHRI